MTQDVRSCGAQATLQDAAQLMWEHDCGCLPVTDPDGRMVGMITDRDMCMAAYTRGQALSQMTVESAMSRETISCSPNDSLRTVEALMRERQIRRIPVVADGQLVGIIGIGDLIRHATTGGVQGTLVMPRVLHALTGIYAKRSATAAAE
jgi:CBS domain-containing protein